MSDTHTPEIRSFNMSRIKSKDTKPEILVRQYLFAHGFRYRKNVNCLPGCPDIVLTKYKTVIFVHGCFWHMHNCGRFRWPTTNREYWERKIINNVERDRRSKEQLIDLGWRVICVWECELRRERFEKTMDWLLQELRMCNSSPQQVSIS